MEKPPNRGSNMGGWGWHEALITKVVVPIDNENNEWF